MGFTLTKKELETLGFKFAEMLLLDREADPEKLGALTRSKDWKAAKPFERKNAIADIARKAREALLASGYKRDVVERKTEKFIRR